MAFATASNTLRLGAVAGALALLLHLIGFSTTGWITFGEGGIGLWQFCSAKQCSSIQGADPKFNATRAMETIGLMLLFLVVSCTFVMMFAGKYRTRKLQLLSAISALAAGLLIEIGVTIFGVDGASFGYSFYLTLIAGVMCFGTGGLLFRPLSNE